MSEVSKLVSIVVIGRNEGIRLQRCLLSIAQIDCKDFTTELIYVDSGSVDNSLEIAGRVGAKVIALTDPHPTAALGRNAGWHLAGGSYVLFLDGDTVLDPYFLVQSLPELKGNTAVIWGHRRELYPHASAYQKVLDLDWMYPAGKSDFCGGDALFRRDVLERTNGFDSSLAGGEEPELCRRLLKLGYVIHHVDRAMTGHDLGITCFAQYWQRAKRTGYAYAEVSERFAATSDPFWRRESRGNRMRAWVFIVTPVLGGMSAVFLANVWPLVAWSTGLCILIIRTAWKVRWKTTSLETLLMYSLHSHLQHIPIYLGQLRYKYDRQCRRGTSLFEYK